MSAHLAQLLAAAVEEFNTLQTRLDQLQQQFAELQHSHQELRDEFQRLSTSSPPGTPDAIARTAETPPALSVPTRGATLVATPAVRDIQPSVRPEPRSSLAPSIPNDTGWAGSGDDGDDVDSQGAARRPFVKWLPTTDDELPMIDARCRLKAAACEWAEQRRQLLAQNVDFRTEIEPRDRDLIWQAKQLPDCFLWMSHSTAPSPADARAWKTLAACFRGMAHAIALIQRMLEDEDCSPELFERGVDLLAEAQSALRIAVTRVSGPPTDHDQARVFGWLKNVASERQIFIRRFMRLDDPADPDRASDLAERLDALTTQWEGRRGRKNVRKKALGRIRHKLSQLPADSAAQEYAAMWKSVAEDVDLLIADGMPPSNVELRDLLLEYVERFPSMAEMPKGFQLTVREIDNYLSTLPESDEAAIDEGDVVSESVAAAADMLAGKAVILIGGDRRPHAAEKLQQAFQLSELIWIDTRAHESVSGFEPYVARPEVAMVLLAIRWSSHSYGEVQDFCRTYGKPLVRLPGGYNPNQVAAQILEQCSQRLVVHSHA